MLKLDNISLPIGFNIDKIQEICAKNLKISQKNIKKCEILKLSLDARRKNNIKYISSIAIELENNLEEKFPSLNFQPLNLSLNYPLKTLPFSPIIVGFGPSGMFAGLTLARMGLKPIIIEQGKQVDERQLDVDKFWKEGKLNKYSNVQFGEGGAGTFSDGKLNSNISNDYCKKVLFELHKFGAPKEILYISKPHIGSDNLQRIVKNIREEIIKLGGKILFSTKFVDFNAENGKLTQIKVQNVQTQEEEFLKTNHLLLCVGHSARDTFKLLYNKNINLQQKPFAMGVRIEQNQHKINEGQYGKDYDKRLPNADYKLVEHLENGRSVFTFCMCPGGQVVASSSEEGEIVTNGMSNFARNGNNANSALLVNVTPSDYNSPHPLAGIDFQAKYEKLAFQLGGGKFTAPAQTVGEFLDTQNAKSIDTTYKPNIKITNISKCLPDFVTQSLKLALPRLNNRLKGFADNENLLIAIESRSSCPLTILRDDNFECNITGIYPVGEGAGYAGGIISSAQDGIKVAESMYSKI